MPQEVSVVWFRQDLRLTDNPALTHAIKQGKILPLYILETPPVKSEPMGEASQVWLHHSLNHLNESLEGKLNFYDEEPLTLFLKLAKKYKITSVNWNRCYEPWRIERDTMLKQALEKLEIPVFSHNGSLLWEPWEVAKKDGTPYKVFTPFYRKGCLLVEPPRQPLSKPKLIDALKEQTFSVPLTQFKLLPKQAWAQKMIEHWPIGEQGAKQVLSQFFRRGLSQYKEGRNRPAKPYTSRLSPYLHFGEISPNQVWYAARSQGDDSNVDHFCSELGWREFSYSLLYYNPELPSKNLNMKFNVFPWQKNKTKLEAWQRGQTGVPMVDAGMRELWATGYMHNRVRMIVGSFLVKNLLLDWRTGAQWFWNTLVDADMANNYASWQWVAGCGADAAPYFRIFNPVTQGEKFDTDGEYIRRWVPELAELPTKYLFAPWEAPDLLLRHANIHLGRNYPKPIVDLKQSRQEALDALASTK
jgi:deoxyribodipyrimidine photo-lyase